ncbi:MAG: hypothetical protein DRQ47_08240 [Gammaproteobacteria bacterium]|nr:MAG: hypothetical protein DRQ47_08240 [Gammaproteobacteria bacterium]
MKDLPFSEDGYKFSVLDNPRESDYVLGAIRCDICNTQTSIYLEIEDEYTNPEFNFPPNLIICKGCLTGFIDAINKRMIETFHESAKRRFDEST